MSTGYTDQSLSIHPIEFILSETTLVSTVAATRQDLADAIGARRARRDDVPIAGRYPLDGDPGRARRAAQAHGPRPADPRPGVTPRERHEPLLRLTEPDLEFLRRPLRLYIDGEFAAPSGR